MTFTKLLPSLLCLSLCLSVSAQMTPQPELGKRLHSRILDWHKGAKRSDQKLKVVYFHAADQDPLLDYQARMDRIMKDIQSFYRDEIARNGFGETTFPLELKEDGDLKLHVVHGASPAASYSYASGDLVRREVKNAMKGTFNLEEEFVLIICGLSQEREDGVHVFHSPYYGMGADQRRGICFAADSRLQDTLYFEDDSTPFRYEEHNGSFQRTLGGFNTLYIGGIAHELGHGLSLPHNGESKREKQSIGTALMGSGNYHYRAEKRGKKGTFMSLASSLRLAVHPLFTGTRKQVETKGGATITDVSFSRDQTALHIEGRVTSELETIGVIAYVDPEGGKNYDARTWVAEVTDGKFKLETNTWKTGKHALRLAFVHVNGSVTTIGFPYEINDKRQPREDLLNGEWILQRALTSLTSRKKGAMEDIMRDAKKRDVSKVHMAMLKHLQNRNERPRLVNPAKTIKRSLYLSDAEWKSAETGWGKPRRNYYAIDNNRQSPLLLPGGQFHEKGFYAHSDSRYVFELGKKWHSFSATAGLQQGVASNGSGVFIIVGDGKELYRTKLLKDSQTEEINVSIKGVATLELIVESGKENNHACWTVWGSPQVKR